MAQDNGCIGCGGGGEKKVSRAEFLASGAAAAVAASVGCASAGPASVAAGFSRPPLMQECRQTCPPTQERWKVTASVLNALWRDCLPRLVAKEWASQGSVPVLNQKLSDVTVTTAMGEFLQKLADEIRKLSGSAKFDTRKELVAKYLDTTKLDRIPIRIISGAGFDYVLSDWGLDIFTPPKPETDAELYLYYTYRNTGNPAIGIPIYLEDAVGGGEIDAPTGPSQAVILPADIEAIIRKASAADLISSECALMAIECLNKSIVMPDEFDFRRAWPLHYDPLGNAARGRWPESDRQRVIEPGVSAEIVKCVLEPLRCWQVTGSVFRGIQVQLPRVIATKWLEQALADNIEGQSYTQRIHAELREVLMERLETSLPNSKRMTFKMHNPATALTPGPADIEITNCGFVFPHAQDYTAFGLQPDDRRRAILNAIAAGQAGNPVFTDSMPCE